MCITQFKEDRCNEMLNRGKKKEKDEFLVKIYLLVAVACSVHYGFDKDTA